MFQIAIDSAHTAYQTVRAQGRSRFTAYNAARLAALAAGVSEARARMIAHFTRKQFR